MKLSKEIELKKKIAVQAATKWKAKQKADILTHNLVQASQEFQRFLISVPLLESWMNLINSEFAKAVLSLLPCPTLETVTIAQRTLNDTRFEDLLSSWKDAREAEIYCIDDMFTASKKLRLNISSAVRGWPIYPSSYCTWV